MLVAIATPLSARRLRGQADHAPRRLAAPGEGWALDLFHHRHPAFPRRTVPWLPKRLTHDDIRAAALDEADARLAVARWYNFADWAGARDPCRRRRSARFGRLPIRVGGGGRGRRRSRRARRAIGCRSVAAPGALGSRDAFDPPIHRATLLHYVAANGVEGYGNGHRPTPWRSRARSSAPVRSRMPSPTCTGAAARR